MLLRYSFPAIILCALFVCSCGTTSRLGKKPKKIPSIKSLKKGEKIEEGIASWYGPNFDGKLTATGERYDMHGLTAAHRTLPFNTILEVKNLDNGKSVRVRVNDRGPYAKNRIIDLSKTAAKKIGMLGPGTAHVALILLNKDVDHSRKTSLGVSTYTIQLGSFRDEQKAFELSGKIVGSRVEITQTDPAIVYHVYYGIYIDKKVAGQKLQTFHQEGFEGYIKQIENSQDVQ